MKRTISAIIVALVALIAIGGVFAYQYGNKNNNQIAIDKDAVEKAVETGDYETWKSLHMNSNGKMVSLINENNFYLLKELHAAKEAGDYTKVQEIKAQLGFKQGMGMGQGNGMHKGQGKNGNNGNCPFAN